MQTKLASIEVLVVDYCMLKTKLKYLVQLSKYRLPNIPNFTYLRVWHTTYRHGATLESVMPLSCFLETFTKYSGQ